MKSIVWIETSLKAVQDFPDLARKEIGYQLYRIQKGLEASDWKPMATLGKGVREIRIHTGEEFRVIYIARFEDAIYILHAFQKKSRSTHKRDLALAGSRLKRLIQSRKAKPK